MDESFGVYYALRITPYPNTEAKTTFVRERIGGFIRTLGGLNYLLGQEYERNHHFHIVFNLPSQLDNIGKKSLRDTLYTSFEVPEEKRGNPSYSLEVVRDLDRALSYAVKGGDYESSDEWRQIAADAYENSHTKKLSMKSSLLDLTTKYMDGDINDRTLFVELGKSRAELGIPLSIRWIDEMMFSIQVKKNPDLLLEKWEERIIKEALKQ